MTTDPDMGTSTAKTEEPEPGVLIIAGQRHFYRPTLAKLLNKSERTLARWHEKGIGPPYNELLGTHAEAGLSPWMESHNKGPVRKPQRRRKLAITAATLADNPTPLAAGPRE